MRSFIEDLGLNLHFLLDLVLHHRGTLFQSGTIGSISGTITQAVRSKICCFYLMYLSKQPMNSRGDIAVRHNFNQVR